MKSPLQFLVSLAFLLSASLQAADPKPAPTAPPSCTFVIVHGAWGGGWAFREVERLLRADGHQIHRPTLTGQGERVHLASPAVGLDTHVEDIVNVILFEDLHDVVLVGHSYGGMVITGVMDRIPERLRQVVFLDAAVPDDGESMNALNGRTPTAEQVKTGFLLPGAKAAAKPIPHDVPHSLKTLTDPVSYRNPAARKLPGTYVAFVGPGQDGASRPAWQRAKARGWSVLMLESDHNAQWSHPKELVALLEQITSSRR